MPRQQQELSLAIVNGRVFELTILVYPVLKCLDAREQTLKTGSAWARLDQAAARLHVGTLQSPHKTLVFCFNLPARHHTIATMRPPTTPPASVEKLDPLHRDAITAAVLRLLDTAPARQTFGQIIDGLPLCHIAYGQQGRRLRGEHPILRHVTFCPGVEEAAAKFRSGFEIKMMTFNPEVGKPPQFLLGKHMFADSPLHSCSNLSKPQIRARGPSTCA
jgi:hypothetical protein